MLAMIKINKLPIVFAATLGFLFLTPSLAIAQENPAKGAINEGACAASGQDNCDPGAATTSINSTIESVINILSLAVGIIAVIMIIVAGFRYITSGGNEQTIATAKKTLTYALIGLVIAVLAQVIARFVLRETTNTTAGALYSISGLTVL